MDIEELSFWKEHATQFQEEINKQQKKAEKEATKGKGKRGRR